MDKFLTSKARPGKLTTLAESAAALLMAVALMIWAFIAVVGFVQDGFMPLAHTLMILIAVPVVMLLSWLLERKRDRIHARAIAGALSVAAKGEIPRLELEKLTGVRDVAKVIARLTAKGVLRNVSVVKDVICTADGEAKRAVCAYCGAALETGNKCPGCGSNAIKY